MREMFLELLHLSDSGQMAQGICVANVVITKDDDGKGMWTSFSSTPPARPKRMAPGWCQEHRDIMDVYLGHLSQWCLDSVTDLQDAKVLRENRMVLDPVYIYNACAYGEQSLNTVLREAKIVRLRAGAWQKRTQVLRWRAQLCGLFLGNMRVDMYKKYFDSLLKLENALCPLPGTGAEGSAGPPPPYTEQQRQV